MANEEKIWNRYPGTKPFEADEYELFKGRDEDIERLYDLISLESLVVLFSRSGLGKSSLLNAGLANKFKEDNEVSPVFIRFGAHYKENLETPVDKLIRKINEEHPQDLQNFLFQKLIAPDQINLHRLWYLFKGLQVADASKNNFVLIFDQFEELFTYAENEIEVFKKELAELLFVTVPQQLRNLVKEQLIFNKDYLTKEESKLLYTPLNIKILLSIRSDKLSLLNQLTDRFPAILKNCYELTSLTRQQARQAIEAPARLTDRKFISPTFTYSNEVLELILNALSNAKRNDAGIAEEKNADIETFQLQIVCKHAENLVIEKGLTKITSSELGNIKDIFENHYRNIIEKLSPVNRLPARKLIEEKLIIDGTRVSMPIPFILKDKGMTKELLNELIATHILRPEENNSIEISHDTLIEPILKYYEERKKEEAVELELREKEEEIKRINAEKEKQLKEQKLKSKRNRTIIAIISLGLIISTYLTIINIRQKEEAITKQKSFRLLSVASDTERTNPSFTIRLLEALIKKNPDALEHKILTNIGYRLLENELFYKTIVSPSENSRLKFSKYGTHILTGTKDGNDSLYDMNGKLLKSFKQNGFLTAVDFSKEGKTMVIGCDDGSIDEWNMDGSFLRHIWKNNVKIKELLVVADEKLILILGSDKTLKLLNTATKKPVQIATLVNCVTLSHSGKQIVYGTDYGAVICNLNGEITGKLMEGTEDNSVSCLAFSPDDKLVAAGYNNGFARIWDVINNKQISAVQNEYIVTSITMFNLMNTNYLMTGLENGTATWWQPVAGSNSLIPKFGMKGLESKVISIVVHNVDSTYTEIFTNAYGGAKIWKGISSLHDSLVNKEDKTEQDKEKLFRDFLKLNLTDPLRLTPEQEKEFGVW